jgi:predicted nuclease of predicted toxin-antitoxin system
VKFLVDAQLPQSLAELLRSGGHDAKHSLDLVAKNRTSDEVLCQLAPSEQRVLVTKDEDFVESHVLRGLPPKLLFVTTGNIANLDLPALFRGNLPAIIDTLEVHSFIEMDRTGLTIHR